jgi:hypothetical protein
MAELNGGQLAILLQNWNHPASEIFGILKPELFSAAKITARTSAPELPGILDRVGSDGASANFQKTPSLLIIAHHTGNDSTHAHFQATSHLITPTPLLPSHTSGATHTTTALLIGMQAQTTSIGGNGSMLGLAAAAVIATGAIFSAYKRCSKYRYTKLIDAQCIAHRKLQLAEASAYKLTVENALKAVESDLSMSNEDKNRLRGQLSVSTKLNNGLIEQLEEAEKNRDRNTKLVDRTIKCLKVEQKRANKLKRNRNTQMQESNKLRDELRKAYLTVSALGDEKSAHEREVQEQLADGKLAVNEALASLEVAQVAAEEKSNLQQENENLRNQVTRLQTKLDEQSDENARACDGLKEKTDSKDRFIDSAQGEMIRLNSQLKGLKETFEEQIREKDSEIGDLRKQKHEADVALGIARERIAQLEKEKTTRNSPKLSVLKTGSEDDNDDDLKDHVTSFINRSQRGSSQQQAGPPSVSESSSNNTTTAEVNGEHSSMSMMMPVPPSGEMNIPSRKRRELWHNYWKDMSSYHVYDDDKVCKMELPCFDARFSRLGIARPAENPEERTLESGKVLEHTKCNHCLQWYTKKDMYDHLKTCKAFWELAIRCGHCKEVFKHNTAFYDKHVPDCKVQSTEEDPSEKHFTLANSEVNATTPQTSQQVGLTSNNSVSSGKQINPDGLPFTPGDSPPDPKLPIPTGPRYHSPNLQQVRGTLFNTGYMSRR